MRPFEIDPFWAEIADMHLRIDWTKRRRTWTWIRGLGRRAGIIRGHQSWRRHKRFWQSAERRRALTELARAVCHLDEKEADAVAAIMRDTKEPPCTPPDTVG